VRLHPTAEQLLLPLDGLCPEFFQADEDNQRRSRREDAAFRMTLLNEYLKAGEGYGAGVTAYLAACELHEREPAKNPASAANKVLSMPESKRMLAHLRARMKAEVEADAAEYYRSLRLMEAVAYGLASVRETYIDPDSGEVMVREVLMPNASNQAKAVELKGRALGMFKDKLEHSGELAQLPVQVNVRFGAGAEEAAGEGDEDADG